MRVYTAPEPVGKLEELASVFLAGSIENGTAVDWQTRVVKDLDKYPITIFNPRRKSWDSKIKQSTDNPVLVEQVNWELDQLERSDIRFFYFDPKTLAPITLMELGFVAGMGIADIYPVIVVCPDGFYRQANVEIICQRNDLLFVRTLDEGVHVLKQAICDLTQRIAH